MNERVGARQRSRQLARRGHEGQHGDAIAGRRWRRAGADRQEFVRCAEAPHRIDEHVEMFFRREAAGVDEQPGRRRIAVPLAPGRIAPARREEHAVDAKRLAGDARHAPGREVAGHAAARSQHEIEAAVDAPRIALGQPRRSAGEAPAGGQARERDDVRVAVGDRRNTERLRRIARRPGDAVGIAGLDDVGRERLQHAGHRRAPDRQPVAAAERQRHRRQGRAAGRGAGNARHGEGVAPARLAGQPLVLGLKVAPHAATGRTPEHRRVDEVERFAHHADCAQAAPRCWPSPRHLGTCLARARDPTSMEAS